jgi:hypothetical protein
MNASKADNTPLHTPLVTLLMHTRKAHARATVRTTGKQIVSGTLTCFRPRGSDLTPG